jgi:RimJ/RimL family protein N-acetyltransferase
VTGVIETERLVLHVLPAALVARLVEGDLEGARALDPPYDIGPETFVDDAGVLVRRHAQLTADPTEEPWLLHAAVLRGGRRVVGRIGFHGPPEEGVVEVGYTVAPAYRRQGLALEMVTGMLAWAKAHGVVACLASVSPHNVASLATVRRLGFVKVGEQIDEEDGLEWVHRLDLR